MRRGRKKSESTCRVVCTVCKFAFDSGRKHALTCSAKCRKERSRTLRSEAAAAASGQKPSRPKTGSASGIKGRLSGTPESADSPGKRRVTEPIVADVKRRREVQGK